MTSKVITRPAINLTIPEPPQLTVDNLRMKVGDLALQVDSQQAYIVTLRAKITELQSELSKTSDAPSS